MQQKLPFSERIVVHPIGRFIMTDMTGDKIDFSVPDLGVGFLQADPSFSYGLDFASQKHNARLIEFQELIVEISLLVLCDELHF
jgi:hypothetical protein